MENFQKLLARIDDIRAQTEWGGHFTFDINPNLLNYESMEDFIEHSHYDCDSEKTKEEVFLQCKKENRLVTMQLYPHTPVGCFCIFSYSIEEAARLMLSILASECPTN
jgi:hypothetical protein